MEIVFILGLFTLLATGYNVFLLFVKPLTNHKKRGLLILETVYFFIGAGFTLFYSLVVFELSSKLQIQYNKLLQQNQQRI